jgi:hypothetical protein
VYPAECRMNGPLRGDRRDTAEGRDAREHGH